MNKIVKLSSAALITVGAVVGYWLTAASASDIIPLTRTNVVFSGTGPIAVPAALDSPKYGSGSNGSVTLQSPSWNPIAESAGSVSTAGDLALIDASSASSGLRVSVYVTNLSALQHDYSSFALPIDVNYLSSSPNSSATPYLATSSCPRTTCSWQLANGDGSSPDVSSSVTYLTSDTGVVSFTLPRGYYDVTMEIGGSFYCTSNDANFLSPSFFVTSKAV